MTRTTRSAPTSTSTSPNSTPASASSLSASRTGSTAEAGYGPGPARVPEPDWPSSGESPGWQRRIAGSGPEPGPIWVTVTSADAQSMPRSVPALIRRVRRELESRLAGAGGHAGGTVVVDLSELPVLGGAVCSQLLLLIRLLQEIVAPTEVVVVGVASTARPCLVGGLPDGMRLIDRRGRSWPH
jgi:hypothetical protein